MIKHLTYVIVIITTLCVLSSCKSTKDVSINNTEPEKCEAMSFNKTSLSQIESDYYTIDTLFITNNCLNIWVSYSGGCGDAEFELFFTDEVLETHPLSTTLLLKLTDNDNCRAIVQQKLFYDLSFFKDYAFNNGIEILIGDKKIMYIY